VLLSGAAFTVTVELPPDPPLDPPLDPDDPPDDGFGGGGRETGGGDAEAA
jgi:hypothetical protein